MKHATLIWLFIAAPAMADLAKTGFEGVRPTGMGNAFIATADDDNAVWYNPAALANVHGVHLSLVDLTLGADAQGSLLQIIKGVGNGDYNSLLTDPKPTLVRTNVRATFTRQYMSLSVFDSLKSYSSIQNIISLDGRLDIDSTNDVGAILGFGVPVDEYLSFGASVKVFQRSALDLHLTTHDVIQTVATTPDLLSQNPYTYLKGFTGLGWGVGLNLGALVTLPMKAKGARWTVAATVDDFGETSFRSLGNNPRPAPIRPSWNLGSALRYSLGPRSELNIELDYRNAMSALPLFKKVHFGAEYKLAFLSLRGGFYEGQPTYGFGLEIQPHTRIQASSYAIEAGDTIGSQSTRWYLFEFVVGFNPM